MTNADDKYMENFEDADFFLQKRNCQMSPFNSFLIQVSQIVIK